jgi:hypothetical protein
MLCARHGGQARSYGKRREPLVQRAALGKPIA